MNALSSPHDNGGRVLDNHMSIQAAAEYSGYNLQYLRRIVRKGEVEGVKVGQVWLVNLYLRRIVRKGEVEGVKVGQVWLVNLASLDAYLKRVQNTDDRRYGPRVYQTYINSQSK